MAVDAAYIAKVKLSLRITGNAFDTELSDLIEAALKDLEISGADGSNVVLSEPIVLRAVTTYCKMHFGEPDEYDRLKKSYDEQKAQLSTATGYTTWTTEV